MLAAYFMAQVHEEQGLPIRELSEEAPPPCKRWTGPATSCQLRNVIERVLILLRG